MIWVRENKTWYSKDVIDKIIYACMNEEDETAQRVLEIIKDEHK